MFILRKILYENFSFFQIKKKSILAFQKILVTDWLEGYEREKQIIFIEHPIYNLLKIFFKHICLIRCQIWCQIQMGIEKDQFASKSIWYTNVTSAIILDTLRIEVIS